MTGQSPGRHNRGGCLSLNPHPGTRPGTSTIDGWTIMDSVKQKAAHR